MSDYADLKQRLARGWNTWNTRSVTSHVLLPEGFAVNLGFKEYRGGGCLRHPLIGRPAKDEPKYSAGSILDDEQVHPGPHAYDGSYTELNLKWRGIELTVQSAHDGDDVVLLVTPLTNQPKPAALIVESAMLWNRHGKLSRHGGALMAGARDGSSFSAS